jgi:hypothetical protein
MAFGANTIKIVPNALMNRPTVRHGFAGPCIQHVSCILANLMVALGLISGSLRGKGGRQLAVQLSAILGNLFYLEPLWRRLRGGVQHALCDLRPAEAIWADL